AKAHSEGRNATLQGDGWTGVNFHHLICFMITVERTLHTVHVHDASSDFKRAEEFLKLIKEVMNLLRNEWHVTVVAVCTDASGEARKARRLLVQEMGNLVAPDCYSHQVNLVVGDYIRSKETVIYAYTKQADELISWLRSRTAVLARIRELCTELGKKPLAVLNAVITRWTAHYVAYSRLLELHDVLAVLVAKDEAMVPENRFLIPKKGKRDAKLKAARMVGILKSSVFWHTITQIKMFLEPLALAANITQAGHCRLDSVLLTFGYLMMVYTKRAEFHDRDPHALQVILASIERRWAKSDQDVFIAAVLLNPFIRASPFASIPERFGLANVYLLLVHLFERFFMTPAPSVLLTEVQDYFAESGQFSALQPMIHSQEALCANENVSPDPYGTWDMFRLSTTGGMQNPPPLVRLALHIFSIVANSASCERLFSVFGHILTKTRNRLTTRHLEELATVKMQIRDQQLADNELKSHVKRHFGKGSEAVTYATLSSALSAESSLMESESDPDSFSDSEMQSLEAQVRDTGRGFAGVAERLTTAVNEDGDDEDFSADVPWPRKFPPIPIAKLFDFNNTLWVNSYKRSAHRSFEEELKFYELVNLDGEGEDEDEEFVINETTEALV
ncbi:hypothetical protein FISHEDRAFT_31177, partial [Fistulina hepatica ATCC 64428]